MKTIKQGMRDEAVKVMQTELSRLGYNLTADGAFGPGTLAAVKDFQHSRFRCRGWQRWPTSWPEVTQASRSSC